MMFVIADTFSLVARAPYLWEWGCRCRSEKCLDDSLILSRWFVWVCLFACVCVYVDTLLGLVPPVSRTLINPTSKASKKQLVATSVWPHDLLVSGCDLMHSPAVAQARGRVSAAQCFPQGRSGRRCLASRKNQDRWLIDSTSLLPPCSMEQELEHVLLLPPKSWTYPFLLLLLFILLLSIVPAFDSHWHFHHRHFFYFSSASSFIGSRHTEHS